MTSKAIHSRFVDLLAVVGHPDDEAINMGGTLAKYGAKGEGRHVAVLSVTRGEGGLTGEPLLCTQEDLGALREKELAAACEILGLARPRFLDYVDPIAKGDEMAAPDLDPIELEWKLAELFRLLRPLVVVTHGSNGEYGHPLHILTNRAVTMAMRSTASKEEHLLPVSFKYKPWQVRKLYYFSATEQGELPRYFANKDDRVNLLLDISPWYKLKVAAFMSHLSQLPGSLRASETSSPEELLTKTERFHRAYPPDVRAPGGDLFDGIATRRSRATSNLASTHDA